ncbi:MAG: alkaline phosphatase family protein [Acidobacteria bacterium]|nr:alkaline phosphatase family protein [Acidobacteriota bacterium]
MTTTITITRLLLAWLLGAMLLSAGQNRLLVISIDGLDHRWLRDCDSLGLRIPHLRKLMDEGMLADGVTGIVPTVTWPSHTTMITGLTGPEHGIVSNNQPGKPGQRWWYVRFLKAKTLWHLAHEKGLKTAAVWWPVTVGADIDYNFPDFREDPSVRPDAFAPVLKHSTPGLAEEVAKAYPSFLRQSLTDRQRVIAARYILEHKQPELFLLQLAELDSEQHATGAFSKNAKATLEYQDELLGPLLDTIPEGTFVTVVSDHGFETQERVFRPKVALQEAGIEADVLVGEGIFAVRGGADGEAARFFRSQIGRPGSVIEREVSVGEVLGMEPNFNGWSAFFENTFGVLPLDDASGPAVGPGNGGGNHGLWPTRKDYRAALLVWGPWIDSGRLPETSMLDIAPTFADILGLELPNPRGKSLWKSIRRE